MSRRQPREEMEFGSDSFLDVVANVVGILIILMVLAGIRAKNSPVDLAKEAPEIVQPNEPEVTVVAEPLDEDVMVARQEELAELQSQSDSLEKELDRLRRAAAADESKLAELGSLDSAQRNRFAALASNLEGESAVLQGNRQEASDLTAKAQAIRARLKKRQAEITAVEKQKHRVEQLRHQITPVSRVINENEKELHFRCLAGLVSEIPIDDLAERMVAHIRRHSDVILRLKRYSATVGPVRGWQVTFYTQSQSYMGIARLSDYQCLFEPDENLVAESLDVAIRPESQFRNQLRKTEPGSTVTFWVYPDSFTLFRKLQAVAHREGFTVAARPMQAGEPIGASPRGTASSAQ